ncbi:hypothetical protein Syun_017478 [Stephania yunnanensis]|uniref:Armadillo repeat-containing protein 8 n=1 Tax=Stephania yunnanensis TaxID=152371 RepID=A0AAP0P5V9_9MAGN
MPSTAAAAAAANQPDELIRRLRSGDGAVKLKALRELKNQIIGNRTKKLSYIKLGTVPDVVGVLASSVSIDPDPGSGSSLIVESAAIIGSFACGVDAGVKAVLEAGAFPHLFRILSNPNEKVVDTTARSLRMIFQSRLAPKYDFSKNENADCLFSLLNSDNENVTGLGASIITHSCKTIADQKILSSAGVLQRLITLLNGSLYQREASLEALTAMLSSNSAVISNFVDLDNGRALSSLINLMEDKSPRTRLLAITCLIVIGRTCSSYLQDIELKNKLILILVELLEEPDRVGDEVPFALANLIVDREDLQRLAFEANALDKLCNFLQRETLQPKRFEGLLLAIAELCSRLESCRSKFFSLKVLNLVINSLKHDAADVRTVACICLRNVTRSVKKLSAGYFMNEMVVDPLIQLLHDSSNSVQVAALSVISNIVVDFANRKSIFLRCGGIKELVRLSQSMDPTLRLNAVLALKNFVFLADNSSKECVLAELTVSTLVSLICDPEPKVQEQALAFVRNILESGIDSIEPVFTEDGIIINAVGRQVRNALDLNVCLEGIYALGNVATGNELHKEAVMHQILEPQVNGPSQSVLMNFLQGNNSQLRVGAIWCLINLTYPDGPGTSSRIARLRDAGVIGQLKKLADDPCLDAKFRVKTALAQCANNNSCAK